MRTLINLIIFIALLASCSQEEKHYRIGVSQCSADIWREKQNAELRMGAYFHDNVELIFASAYDSDERQIQQIDSLLAADIDLLIVAPNQVATISPAIDRTYEKGIPVIVFERKTNSHKYTASMSADNYEMGRVMGEYVAARLQGKGRVIEVEGLKGSSPAIERHKGFVDALSKKPGIQLVTTLQGDWTEQSAYDAVMSCSKEQLADIDFVFGQNDRMVMGARRALLEQRQATPASQSAATSARLPFFCGIDGLPGEGGGIQLVRDSVLDATYIYPTHGDRLLSLAIDILDGKPYKKETNLMSALVTHENAHVLLMQNEEIVRQSGYLDSLHNKASFYLQQLSAQRTINWLVFGLWLLLVILVMGIWLFIRQRTRIHRERNRMAREQLDFYTQVSHELRTPLTLIEGPLAQLASAPELQQATAPTVSLFDIVRRNTRQLTELINKMLDVQVKGEVAVKGMSQDLPTLLSPSPELSATDSSLTASPSSQEDTTILIVDDNADIRAYLNTVLKDHYNVVEAEDGQIGLERAKQQVPDLIVSDVMMPVMNGLEFCQHVKDDFVTSHIPVILLTARALSHHQVEGYRSGADAYITKPFAADVLLARIDNLLRSRRQLKNLWDKPVAPTPVPLDEAAADSQSTMQSPQPEQVSETPAAITEPESPFVSRFKAVIEEHLSDSELSVETIGAELGLSRVQLYRKVKALTGTTPVDLLRKARLVKSRQLLVQTDLSVSEIAYKVGFTSPSYFTKCFKDEYGMVPGDARR